VDREIVAVNAPLKLFAALTIAKITGCGAVMTSLDQN
jgi:hypothetical protein